MLFILYKLCPLPSVATYIRLQQTQSPLIRPNIPLKCVVLVLVVVVIHLAISAN